MRRTAAVSSSKRIVACPYPLVPSLSARVVLLGKVPQVVIVVEVEKLYEVLKQEEAAHALILSFTQLQEMQIMFVSGILIKSKVK